MAALAIQFDHGGDIMIDREKSGIDLTVFDCNGGGGSNCFVTTTEARAIAAELVRLANEIEEVDRASE